MNSFFVKNITVLSIVSSAFAFAGNTDGYNIKIKVKGLKEGSTCMLANYYGEKQYIKDSAKVNAKGQVIFQGKEKMPQGIYLFVPANRKYFDFVMDEKQNTFYLPEQINKYPVAFFLFLEKLPDLWHLPSQNLLYIAFHHNNWQAFR